MNKLSSTISKKPLLTTILTVGGLSGVGDYICQICIE